MAPTTPTALTVNQVASRLAVHPQAVVKLIKAGKLPAANLGHGRYARYRVDPAAVDRLLSQTQTPAPVRPAKASKGKKDNDKFWSEALGQWVVRRKF